MSNYKWDFSNVQQLVHGPRLPETHQLHSPEGPPTFPQKKRNPKFNGKRVGELRDRILAEMIKNPKLPHTRKSILKMTRASSWESYRAFKLMLRDGTISKYGPGTKAMPFVYILSSEYNEDFEVKKKKIFY